MDDETPAEIARLVRVGRYTKAELREVICEEMYEPGELDAAEVGAVIDDAWADLLAEQESWPSETDCDRLDRVFASLAAAGVIAIQDAGYTQDDGYEEIRAAFDRRREGSGDASDVVGYCFFHRQDLERAIDGGGLYLAFGPMDPNEEAARGPAVGKQVTAALAGERFVCEWDGTFATRILVPAFVWRRRIARDA